MVSNKLICTVMIVLLLIAVKGYSQTNVFADYSNEMKKDSLFSHSTRRVTDIWFNAAGVPGYGTLNTGDIDLDIYAEMVSSVAGIDSLVYEGYGLKYKYVRTGVDTEATWQTMVGDSIRIATIAVDSTLHSYAIESYYSYFPMFDGFRIVEKSNGTDADSSYSWKNVRTFKK